MRRLSLYAFVITLAWLCFVIAIAFIDAPAKFEALGLKKPWTETTPELQHALAIGRLSFHKLNRIEWICAAFSVFLAVRLRVVRARGAALLLGVVIAILAAETWMLHTVMDERVRQILSGTLPAETWHHVAYIAADVVKVSLLGVLCAMQVQSFARAVISE
jgi:hypothetical protein